MHFLKTSLVLLSLSSVLSGCGGGGETDGEDTGPPPGTQQYPAGVWEGTTGAGASARTVLGYIDPGTDGKGGEFYFAKSAAGTAGYDALYGRLRANVTSVLATNVTYFSVQDGKFSNALTLRGTASANAKTGRTELISGNYSDPVGTIAATGAAMPIKLTYSVLNNYPAQLSLIEGTYRGGSVFGGGWALEISALGTVTGSIGSCALTGTATVRPGNSAVYGINLNVTGDEKLCPNANTTQSGVAILKFDPNSLARTGIWMLTRNGSGNPTTYTLDGNADRPNSSQPATQQYPAGVWEGTTGAGASARTVLGYIDPGTDGKGGEFYFAKSAAGTVGYDALYGRLRVNVNSVLASNVTYFSAQDGQFSNAVTLRGTASSNPQTSRPELISGSYSDPVGTIAAIGSAMPIELTYSVLNNYPAQLSLIEGRYRGGSVFGGGWALEISPLGNVTGSIGSCALNGTATVRPGNSAVYGINLNVTGDDKLCPNANTTQSGVAILKFDANSLARTGIWVLTRNGSGTAATTYTLDGAADGPNTQPPAPTQQSAAGYWQGTTNASGNTAVNAVVLPDSSYFFYKRVGAGYDVLYGTLLTSAGSSVVSSNDGTYFANQRSAATQYTSGIGLNGDVRTGQSFTGSYVDPTAGGINTRFATTPDKTYLYVSPLPRSVRLLQGSYYSNAVGFGGVSTELDLDEQGVLTGISSDGCKLSAVLRPYAGSQNLNFYQVESLGYTGPCASAGGPLQSGMASAQFDAAGTRVTGLRILAAATGPSGSRVNTVFLGSWQPTKPKPIPEPEPEPKG